MEVCNKKQRMELHLHTRENDLVVRKNAPEIVRDYHDAGFAGIVVTNHYFEYAKTWFPYLNGDDKDVFLDYFLEGYHAAKAAGDLLNMTVLLGAEVRFHGSDINDYLIYGLDEADLRSLPLLYQMDLKSMREALPPYAVIVYAHPFRDGMRITPPDLVDGIEVQNGGTPPFRNRLAGEWAVQYGKIMTSGSDYHYPEHLGSGGILVDEIPKTEKQLAQLLKGGDYGLILPDV